MTRNILLLTAAVLLLFTARNAPARTPKESIPEENADTLAAAGRPRFDFRCGIDLMSSYVCRGSYQSGASFQPSVRASWSGFYIMAWGSVDFAGTQVREVDLSIGYRTGRFEATLTDYYVEPLASGGGLSHIGNDILLTGINLSTKCYRLTALCRFLLKIYIKVQHSAFTPYICLLFYLHY